MTSFQTTTLLVLGVHVATVVLLWTTPSGLKVMLSLNSVAAVAVLLYAASRAHYIFAAKDWPYVALVVAELVVLASAMWAFGSHRAAVIVSFVAFGLHSIVSIGSVIFAFTFKITRLM